MNCIASVGVVGANVLSPVLADYFSWRVVIVFWIGALALALACCCFLLPLWRRFWKKHA